MVWLKKHFGCSPVLLLYIILIFLLLFKLLYQKIIYFSSYDIFDIISSKWMKNRFSLPFQIKGTWIFTGHSLLMTWKPSSPSQKWPNWVFGSKRWAMFCTVCKNNSPIIQNFFVQQKFNFKFLELRGFSRKIYDEHFSFRPRPGRFWIEST